MIVKETFKNMLNYLGFTLDSNEVYVKYFKNFDAYLKVDFKNELLIYPEDKGMIVNERFTTNFNDNENFVVFEAVNRLLDKGYKPEHIELERRWQLGRTKKSGRADICVMDKENNLTLLIIECKTYGSEYKKAIKELEEDGGQLFSYFQQERSSQWISLYASDFSNNSVVYENKIIQTIDDPNILELSKKDHSIELFKNATTAEKLFEVWSETYSKKLWDDLIFGSDTVAYKIGVKPLRKKDLKEFNPDDKIVNKFEEILRHNNVSDKENAFNRLVALFTCKLVDEINKTDEDEVEFQYKIGTDTYESLQDRLQKLHQQGMEKFMKEEIYYVSSDYPEQLFINFTGEKRQRAIDDLKEKFKILKFYTNNDFAFKDVHNEELFLQNGKILVEMVQLFENYKIVYQSKHQFLGDLFEQLLNKGFKQNEGQFFTPMPITSFIWDSLPLEKFRNQLNDDIYPKVIDYACGAGHFLTDGIETINKVFNNTNNLWASDRIYGIEKDYRLARVSKISLFMNGAGEGNIIFGDGLENDIDKGIKPNSFDILVANPPYSVAAFKRHIKLKNNSFNILDKISENGSEIEVLFIERISQLLKPLGVAGVILPTSVLVNNSESYIAAREEILKNFKIRAIVNLADKTFGATGTNTVVMFLEKFNEPPKKYLMHEDISKQIIKNRSLDNWNDKKIFNSYLDEIDILENDYLNFLNETLELDEIKDIEYFSQYLSDFNNSNKTYGYKRLINTSIFKKSSKDDKNILIKQEFYKYSKSIEEEKIYYFSLIHDQETLVIISPKQSDQQKEFLGYNWSNRKGQEGIQINNLGGMLFDPANRNSNKKISNYIRNTFKDDYDIPIDSDWEKQARIFRTSEMINFYKPDFNKAINVSLKTRFTPKTDYTNVRLGKFDSSIKIIKGTTITKEESIKGDYKVVAGGKQHAYTHNTYNRDENVITVSASGEAGFVNYWDEKIFASDSITIQTDSVNKTKFIYYYLKAFQSEVYALSKGIAQKHVYPSDLQDFLIPNFPESIQIEIVQKNEEKYKKIIDNKHRIDEITAKIYELYESISNGSVNYRLNDESIFDLSIGRRILKNETSPKFDIPVISANVFQEFGKINKLLITDFKKPSVVWGIDGDWMVNVLPKNYKFYPTDHCGVMRVDDNKINPKFAKHMLDKMGEVEGFSRQKRASIERIKELKFNGPNIDTQNNIVKEIEVLENKISKLDAEIEQFNNNISDNILKYFK